MQEILSGIYQLTLTLKGFSPDSINVYLLQDTDGFTIVDTGWGSTESLKSMETQLREAGIRFNDIKRVILTHLHLDHLGLMGRFKDLNHATICIHRNEMELMKIRYQAGDVYWPMTDKFLRTHGVPESTLSPPQYPLPSPVFLTTPDILFEGNEELSVGEYVLRIINTPGHTPGHLSLYEPQKRFLISGDILLPTILTNAATHVQHIPNPIQQYMNSLRTLRNLDIDLVLPGHEYVFSNHRKRIDEIIEHYRQKKEGVWGAFNKINLPLTAYDVARQVKYSVRNRTLVWDQLSGLNKRFAVLQTIALLEELTASKKLIKSYQGETIYYAKSNS